MAWKHDTLVSSFMSPLWSARQCCYLNLWVGGCVRALSTVSAARFVLGLCSCEVNLGCAKRSLKNGSAGCGLRCEVSMIFQFSHVDCSFQFLLLFIICRPSLMSLVQQTDLKSARLVVLWSLASEEGVAASSKFLSSHNLPIH